LPQIPLEEVFIPEPEPEKLETEACEVIEGF
jgi:hypothetical protein